MDGCMLDENEMEISKTLTVYTGGTMGCESQSRYSGATELFQTLVLYGVDIHIPANSRAIAFPIGCVAPVTTQTKPYCSVTVSTAGRSAIPGFHVRAFHLIDRARRTPSLTCSQLAFRL